MASPLISVIVATRNRHHLLPRALQSLYSQTLKDFEIILVDDNVREKRVRSSPELASVLTDPRLRVIEHDSPRNAAAARNCGLRASHGQWIAYLDDDDAYHPAKLEKQLRAAEVTSLPLGLCGMAFNLPGRRRIRQVGCDIFSGEALLLDVSPGTVAIFHRRAETVFFDEELDAAEDAHFFFMLLKHFGVDRVFNMPEPLVEVFPQPGPRVNLNGPAHWKTAQAIYEQVAPLFGPAGETYLTLAEFQSYKFREGGWRPMTKLGLRLLRTRGLGQWRVVANAVLFKFPWTRRLVVS